MSKNFLENLGKIAVFRTKEQSLGEPQTNSGVSMAFDLGSGLGLERTVEDDRDQIRGIEFAQSLYYAGQTASGKLSQKRAKPDLLSFALAYFFGQVQSQEVANQIEGIVLRPRALPRSRPAGINPDEHPPATP